MAAAGLLLLAGCEGRHTDVFDESIEATYPLSEDVAIVRVDLLEGAITFQPGPAGVVRIQAVTRRAATDPDSLLRLREVDMRPTVEPSQTPGELFLRGPQLPEGLHYPEHRLVTRCLVEVPAGIAVVGVTGSGHMAAIGRRAHVRLESGHGAIRLDDCVGHAVLRSARGAVVIDHHRGSIDLQHGVWQGEPLPDEDLRKGETMQIFIDELGQHGVRIAAQYANVQCHIPKTASFVMDVTSGAGRGKNGFGIPVEPREGKKFGVAMRGTVGDGGPPVTIAVDYGNVSVRARPDVPAGATEKQHD